MNNKTGVQIFPIVQSSTKGMNIVCGGTSRALNGRASIPSMCGRRWPWAAVLSLTARRRIATARACR